MTFFLGGHKAKSTPDAQAQAIGTCCCKWECSHHMQATPKDLGTNLHAHVQCGYSSVLFWRNSCFLFDRTTIEIWLSRVVCLPQLWDAKGTIFTSSEPQVQIVCRPLDLPSLGPLASLVRLRQGSVQAVDTGTDNISQAKDCPWCPVYPAGRLCSEGSIGSISFPAGFMHIDSLRFVVPFVEFGVIPTAYVTEMRQCGRNNPLSQRNASSQFLLRTSWRLVQVFVSCNPGNVPQVFGTSKKMKFHVRKWTFWGHSSLSTVWNLIFLSGWTIDGQVLVHDAWRQNKPCKDSFF